MNKLIILWALALCFCLPPLSIQGQIQDQSQEVPSGLRLNVMDLLDEASLSSKEDAHAFIQRLEEYLPLVERTNDFFLIGRSRLVLGKLLASQEDLSALREAVNQYLAAASAFEAANDLPSLATSHLLAGEGFMFFKDYSQAIQHILQALARFEVMEDSVAVMRCCQLLAESFFQTQAWIEAEKYARRSEEMARHGGLDSVLVSSLTRLGQINHMQGRSDIAMAYLSEAHQMAKVSQSKDQMAAISNLMGRISFDRGQISRARTLHQQALRNARLQPDPVQKAYAFLGLAKSNDWGSDGAKVKPWLDSALFTGRQHDLESVVLEAYDTYANAYLDLAQIDSFRTYQSLSKDLQSILDERAQANLIQRISAQFERQKQSLLIQNLKQERALKVEELAKTRTQNQFAITVGVLLLILAAVLFQQYRSKQKVNQRLGALVERRTEQLKVANEGLQEVNQELDTFAYRTAHDIRGPVARLLGLSQIAMREKEALDSQKYLAMIHREAVNMDFMLHRFLEVNNIKHQTLSSEPILLEELIDKVKEDLGHLEGFPMLHIKTDFPPKLEVVNDRLLLEIVVKNLMENAILYADERIDTSWLLIRALRHDDKVELRFEDNGIGIEPSVAPRIFEMFFRGTTQSKGLGLGLYATSLAAQKTQVQVKYLPRAGKGSVFTLLIPGSLEAKG